MHKQLNIPLVVATAALWLLTGCPNGPEQVTVDSSSSTSSSSSNETSETDPTDSTGEVTEAETGGGTTTTTGTDNDAVCGDGVVEGDEECDDANANQQDDCVKCAWAYCGDGYVQAGVENCDDANQDDDDACPSTCDHARCGDGFVKLGDEECDDANEDPNDGCNAECIRTRTVFVTSEFYQGDFGGLLGADHVCQILAEEAGLERASTFMAWLADETGAPLTRFHRSKGRYALVTGLPIAESWEDLTDGMIKTPIVVDERGELTDGTAVFTNTTVGGSLRDSDASCESWTAIGVDDQTWIGYSGATDFEWVDSTFANPYGCPASARLYCFEQ